MCFLSNCCVPGSVLGMAHTKIARGTTSLMRTEVILSNRGSWVISTCNTYKWAQSHIPRVGTNVKFILTWLMWLEKHNIPRSAAGKLGTQETWVV